MEAVRSWPLEARGGGQSMVFQPLTLNLFIKVGTFSARFAFETRQGHLTQGLSAAGACG